MSKVICIKDNWVTVIGPAKDPSPSFGDVDEVIGNYLHLGTEYYFLGRFGYDIAYATRNFIPLSDIDETEILAEHLDADLAEIILENETV